MKKNWALGFALVLGASMFLALAVPTGAEEQSMGQSTCALDTSWSKPFYSSDLFGALVLDQDRQELGRVVGVTVDSKGELTDFLIVSSCLPGGAEELVAIPFKGYPYSPSEGIVILGLSKEDFMNAPRYTGMTGEDWANRAYEYWEKTPYFG